MAATPVEQTAVNDGPDDDVEMKDGGVTVNITKGTTKRQRKRANFKKASGSSAVKVKVTQFDADLRCNTCNIYFAEPKVLQWHYMSASHSQAVAAKESLEKKNKHTEVNKEKIKKQQETEDVKCKVCKVNTKNISHHCSIKFHKKNMLLVFAALGYNYIRSRFPMECQFLPQEGPEYDTLQIDILEQRQKLELPKLLPAEAKRAHMAYIFDIPEFFDWICPICNTGSKSVLDRLDLWINHMLGKEHAQAMAAVAQNMGGLAATNLFQYLPGPNLDYLTAEQILALPVKLAPGTQRLPKGSEEIFGDQHVPVTTKIKCGLCHEEFSISDKHEVTSPAHKAALVEHMTLLGTDFDFDIPEELTVELWMLVAIRQEHLEKTRYLPTQPLRTEKEYFRKMLALVSQSWSCNVCNVEIHSWPEWTDHMLGRPHAEACVALVDQGGRKKYQKVVRLPPYFRQISGSEICRMPRLPYMQELWNQAEELREKPAPGRFECDSENVQIPPTEVQWEMQIPPTEVKWETPTEVLCELCKQPIQNEKHNMDLYHTSAVVEYLALVGKDATYGSTPKTIEVPDDIKVDVWKNVMKRKGELMRNQKLMVKPFRLEKEYFSKVLEAISNKCVVCDMEMPTGPQRYPAWTSHMLSYYHAEMCVSKALHFGKEIYAATLGHLPPPYYIHVKDQDALPESPYLNATEMSRDSEEAVKKEKLSFSVKNKTDQKSKLEQGADLLGGSEDEEEADDKQNSKRRRSESRSESRDHSSRSKERESHRDRKDSSKRRRSADRSGTDYCKLCLLKDPPKGHKDSKSHMALLADYIAMVDDRDDKLARDLRPTSSKAEIRMLSMVREKRGRLRSVHNNMLLYCKREEVSANALFLLQSAVWNDYYCPVCKVPLGLETDNGAICWLKHMLNVQHTLEVGEVLFIAGFEDFDCQYPNVPGMLPAFSDKLQTLLRGRKMVRSIPDKYWAGKQTFDKTKSKKKSTEIVTAMGLSATATSSTPALPATGRAPVGGLLPSAVLQEPVPLDSTSTQLGLPPGPMAFLQAISGGATMPPQALPLPSMVSAPGLTPGAVVQGFPPVSMPPPLGLPPGALVSSGLPPTSIPPPGLPPGSLISPNFPPNSMAPPGLPPGAIVLQGLPPSLAPPQGFPPSTLAQPGLPSMALSMPPGFVTSTSTTQPLVASSILTPHGLSTGTAAPFHSSADLPPVPTGISDQPSGPRLGNTKGVQLAQLLCKVFGGGTAKKTAPETVSSIDTILTTPPWEKNKPSESGSKLYDPFAAQSDDNDEDSSGLKEVKPEFSPGNLPPWLGAQEHDSKKAVEGNPEGKSSKDQSPERKHPRKLESHDRKRRHSPSPRKTSSKDRSNREKSGRSSPERESVRDKSRDRSGRISPLGKSVINDRRRRGNSGSRSPEGRVLGRGRLHDRKKRLTPSPRRSDSKDSPKPRSIRSPPGRRDTVRDTNSARNRRLSPRRSKSIDRSPIGRSSRSPERRDTISGTHFGGNNRLRSDRSADRSDRSSERRDTVRSTNLGRNNRLRSDSNGRSPRGRSNRNSPERRDTVGATNSARRLSPHRRSYSNDRSPRGRSSRSSPERRRGPDSDINKRLSPPRRSYSNDRSPRGRSSRSSPERRRGPNSDINKRLSPPRRSYSNDRSPRGRSSRSSPERRRDTNSDRNRRPLPRRSISNDRSPRGRSDRSPFDGRNQRTQQIMPGVSLDVLSDSSESDWNRTDGGNRKRDLPRYRKDQSPSPDRKRRYNPNSGRGPIHGGQHGSVFEEQRFQDSYDTRRQGDRYDQDDSRYQQFQHKAAMLQEYRSSHRNGPPPRIDDRNQEHRDSRLNELPSRMDYRDQEHRSSNPNESPPWIGDRNREHHSSRNESASWRDDRNQERHSSPRNEATPWRDNRNQEDLSSHRNEPTPWKNDRNYERSSHNEPTSWRDDRNQEQRSSHRNEPTPWRDDRNQEQHSSHRNEPTPWRDDRNQEHHSSRRNEPAPRRTDRNQEHHRSHRNEPTALRDDRNQDDHRSHHSEPASWRDDRNHMVPDQGDMPKREDALRMIQCLRPEEVEIMQDTEFQNYLVLVQEVAAMMKNPEQYEGILYDACQQVYNSKFYTSAVVRDLLNNLGIM